MSQIKLKKTTTAIIILLIFAILTLGYNFKSVFFRMYLTQVIERVEQRHGIAITFSNAKMKGLSKFELNEIIAQKNDGSFKSSVLHFYAEIPIKHLLRFKLEPTYIRIDSFLVDIQANTPVDYGKRVTGFEKKKKEDEIEKEKASPTTTPKEQVPLLEDFKFNTRYLFAGFKGLAIFATSRIEINDLNFNYKTPTQSLSISTKSIKSDNGFFNSEIVVNEDNSNRVINIMGHSDKDDEGMSIGFSGKNPHPVSVPLVESLLNLTCKFDTLTIALRGKSISRDSIHFTSSIITRGLTTFYPQLSDKEVHIDFAEFNLGASITPHQFNVDTTSTLTINSLTIPISLNVETKESVKAQLSVNRRIISAKSIFDSLPPELFPSIRGISVSGNTDFELFIDIDFSNPENMVFHSKLTPNDFKLLAFGNIDFSMLNDTFTHYIYHNDSIVKSIRINDDNRSFRQLEQISPYLINAVVVAEDGGFFHHKGFDPEGFRYAMARNIKDRRLARGGSTITMQMVKNLFLSHRKYITRKAEEAIIVWLLETQRLVEKERILEIYLNIIDWGPFINGITEASEFYFKKDPLEIELNEAIFLASVIPRPNQFMHHFDSLGNLKSHMEKYYDFIGNTMLERNMINMDELEHLEPNVMLKGFAAQFIKKPEEIFLKISN